MRDAVRPDHLHEQLCGLALDHGRADWIGLLELNGDVLQRHLYGAVSKSDRRRQFCPATARHSVERLISEFTFDRNKQVGRGRVALIPSRPIATRGNVDYRAGLTRREGNPASVDEVFTA